MQREGKQKNFEACHLVPGDSDLPFKLNTETETETRADVAYRWLALRVLAFLDCATA